MRSFLRNIRSKPKAVRNQYALGFSLAFTGAIAAVWLFSGQGFDSTKAPGEASEPTAPFANLTKQMKEQWASARASLSAESTTTATTTVADNPLTLTISEETKAELASSSAPWTATSTTTTSPEYIVVQIATSSGAVASTSAPATSSVRN